MGFRELTIIDVRELLRRRPAGESARRAARECGADQKKSGLIRLWRAPHSRIKPSTVRRFAELGEAEGPGVLATRGRTAGAPRQGRTRDFSSGAPRALALSVRLQLELGLRRRAPGMAFAGIRLRFHGGSPMAKCARQKLCPLFTVPAMAPALALWRAFYCDDTPERCERLRQVRAGVTAPVNMLPNGKLLALAEIEE